MSIISEEELKAAREATAAQRALALALREAEIRLLLDRARPMLAWAPEPFRTALGMLADVIGEVL